MLLRCARAYSNCCSYRLAVDMDIHGYIHGYIHAWISDLSHPVDISMDIMLAHLLITFTTYMLCLCKSFSFLVFIFSFIHAIESNE